MENKLEVSSPRPLDNATVIEYRHFLILPVHKAKGLAEDNCSTGNNEATPITNKLVPSPGPV